MAQLKLSLSEANELLDFLGPWSALTQYDVNDVVTYEGSSYVALTVNINVVPGTAPTIWILLAAAGEGTELNFTGPYSTTTAYDVNDVVNYGGSSYVAILPSVNKPVNNTAYWTLLAAAGTPLKFTGLYSATTTYAVNDVATSPTGSTYVAILAGTGNPLSDTTYWVPFTTGGTVLTFRGVYSPTTSYGANDVATYNGSSYVAIASSTGSTPPTSPDWVLLAQAGATGPAGSGGGIIVFSSGATTKAAVVASPPSVMGFGVLIPITTVDQVQFAQCAFPVPSTGTISNLQASVDLHLAPSTGQDALTYTFTIYDSPGGSGWKPASNEYMTTLMTVDLNIPMIGGGQFTGGTYASFTNLTAASPVNVTAGDRLVLVLNSNGTDPAAIDDISFGATLTYSY